MNEIPTLVADVIRESIAKLEQENARLVTLVAIASEGLKAAGSCTPYRHSGRMFCQHSYDPAKCPIRRALTALGREAGSDGS